MRFLDRAEAAKTVRKLEWRSGKMSPQFTLFDLAPIPPFPRAIRRIAVSPASREWTGATQVWSFDFPRWTG